MTFCQVHPYVFLTESLLKPYWSLTKTFCHTWLAIAQIGRYFRGVFDWLIQVKPPSTNSIQCHLLMGLLQRKTAIAGVAYPRYSCGVSQAVKSYLEGIGGHMIGKTAALLSSRRSCEACLP
jgi:hypothetical protein